MPLPSRAEILGFIASREPLEKTLERFPGVSRDQLRALLREAAVLMQAEEQGAEAPEVEAAPEAAPRQPAHPERPRATDRSDRSDLSDRSEAVNPDDASLSKAKRLRVYSDGAARGNPGPAGAGAVLTKTDGTVIAKAGKFLGDQTNNFAEYTGLIIGLETALRLGAEEVEVYADSELMVRQLQRVYRVKSGSLRPLFEKASDLLARFKKTVVQHVPREQNKLADEMSNRAIDEKL